MKASMWGVSALAVALFGSGYVASAADDAPKPASSASSSASASTDKTSADKTSADKISADKASAPQAASAKSEARSATRSETRGGRLTRPWRDIGSLSEDQKQQIAAIHRKAVQETNAIEEREKSEIMALLNEQQKSELKSIQEKDAADRKARAGNRSGAARSNANTDQKQ